jgi:hypothetical protein
VAEGEHNNELTFKAAIDSNGFERDWDDEYDNNTVSQYRLKVPGGKTYTLTGQIDDLDVTSNVGGAVEFSAKVIGKAG